MTAAARIGKRGAKVAPAVTDWLHGELKPAHIGVYERDYGFNPSVPLVAFSYWSGKRFYGSADNIDEARDRKFVSASQNLPWRGLAADPSKAAS